MATSNSSVPAVAGPRRVVLGIVEPSERRQVFKHHSPSPDIMRRHWRRRQMQAITHGEQAETQRWRMKT
jgi:hypothetical protein